MYTFSKDLYIPVDYYSVMKRKIVKHGTSTLTVSLPCKWSKKYNLVAGDEIEVKENGHLLQIGAHKPNTQHLTMDIKPMGNDLARFVTAIYKAGFDKVQLRHHNPDTCSVIQDTVYRNCHVFEIINISKDHIDIRSISKLNPAHMQEMLEKSAQATLNVAVETIESLRKNDYDQLFSITLKDKIIDRYTVFGNRILNKGYDIDGHLTGPLYLVFDQIETIGDAIKRLCKHVRKNKISLDDKLLDFFSDIVEFIEMQFDLLLDYSNTKIRRNSDLETSLRKKFSSVSSMNKETQSVALMYLIFETVNELKSAIFSIHLNKTFKTKDI